MAEGEDVIVDAARHATVFVRDLWRRRRRPEPRAPAEVRLSDVAVRLDLFVTAALGITLALRPAQPPARRTMLRAVFDRERSLHQSDPLPATDGRTIWLPAALGLAHWPMALDTYRVLCLHQGMRALRESPRYAANDEDTLRGDLYCVLEALAAEDALMRLLPGMSAPLRHFRTAALSSRPAFERFGGASRCVEQWVRSVLDGSCSDLSLPATPASCWTTASIVARRLRSHGRSSRNIYVFRDAWIGEMFVPADAAGTLLSTATAEELTELTPPPSSARMARRPKVREPRPDEDDRRKGAWMIQTAQPHEHAEDGLGMQRPTDRDVTTAAEDFADSLSELPEARLIATPGRPKEVLLSDDPPQARARARSESEVVEGRIAYPEWDWRRAAYREPGAIVHVRSSPLGSERWVAATLLEHAGVLRDVRRRFEMLRATRMTLRRRVEGDEIDLAACVDARADFAAGLPLNEAVYQQRRAVRRDTAVMLLIDTSGSTDAWIRADKRIVDVEREALLLVATALDGANVDYAVLTFSSEGPRRVQVQYVKCFDERATSDVARRIAALEPQQYTRTGAALRHASAMLMRRPARHRLLLLFSDGKPNDLDEYEGRYGIEDTRQAVVEARLQGIFPFCLTVDRQAASYLPRIFGTHQYACLNHPERLPSVLLEWMHHLLADT